MNFSQQPINSVFGAASTVSDVMQGVDLTGKNIIVTGGYSGLGYQAVCAFSKAGANIVVPARDTLRAEKTLKSLERVEVMKMDLSSSDSITEFAQNYLNRYDSLHILINNAGIMALPDKLTDEKGIELQFSTNHLGHFQLTGLLWPALIKAGGARVVTLSSRAHRLSPIRFDDISFKREPYDRWLAYGQAKTANALFAYELARRAAKYNVQSFSVHPGAIYSTGLMKNMDRNAMIADGKISADGQANVDLSKDMKSAEQGAATSVWCAVSPDLDGYSGQYCEDVNISPLLPLETPKMILGDPASMTRLGVDKFAANPTDALLLWELSEALTNINYPK